MRSEETRAATCVVCDRPLRGGGGPAAGFCPGCAAELGMVPVEDLLRLTPDEVDRLPFGFIALDPEGVVTAYNAFEERLSGMRAGEVVGRAFFRDVAPCTAVRGFEGRYHAMVRAGSPRVERFRYVFRFAAGERLVQITLAWVERERRGLLVVRDLAAH